MLGLTWIWACVTYGGLGLDVLHSGTSWPTNTTDNDFNSIPLSSLVLFPIKFYLSGKARKQVFLNLLGKFDFFEHLHLHEKPGSWKTGSLNKETCLDFHLFSNPHQKWFELKSTTYKMLIKEVPHINESKLIFQHLNMGLNKLIWLTLKLTRPLLPN